LTARQLHEVRLLTYQMWQLVEATGAADINAVIEGKSDIKNYAEYLFEHCGEAILT